MWCSPTASPQTHPRVVFFPTSASRFRSSNRTSTLPFDFIATVAAVMQPAMPAPTTTTSLSSNDNPLEGLSPALLKLTLGFRSRTRRILTASLVTPSTHILSATTCVVLSSLIGLYFIFALSLPYLFILGLIGVISTYAYVGSPFRPAYRGLGELVVRLNFGPVMTLGAYYVQAHSFAIEPLLASIPVGLLIAAVLWINEFPDMDADNAVGKKTLVLRLGYAKSITVYVGMVVTAYILIILYALLEIFSPGITSLTSLIALLSLPFALKAIRILRVNYKDPHAIIPANANTIFLHLSFGVLAILGFVVGAALGL